MTASGEQRHGISLSSLDDQLFAGADATKRDLLDHLEAVADVMLPGLVDRPLSVIRVRPGQPAFMQKNLPAYAPASIRRVPQWSEASHREVAYAVAEDVTALVWFGNQRAVEYHVPLYRLAEPDRPTALVLDLDPPEGTGFDVVVAAARVVRHALDEAGLVGAVKTSGSKGVHVVVPLGPTTTTDAAAATRALAVRAERADPALTTTAYLREDRDGKVFLDPTRVGGGTLAAVYSPRVRPGTAVSFPVAWDDLDAVTPADFTVRTVLGLLNGRPSWEEHLPAPQELPADLVAEGHEIPVARVLAMHEGKRRKRAREAGGGDAAK
ncbi:ATP-dependent DNA ligase [Microlunatus spumicola]|uniref:ATP-dependent DNA ligase n=1 Tax=Microlunatus spumicola TaxID=81499 RepID=A0ABP6XSP5_9ACTN